MEKERRKMKTEPAIGYGLRVGGSLPYLAWEQFWRLPEQVKCTERYHRPMKAVLLPYEEWRRLIKLDKEKIK